jgi:cofilin
MAHLTSDAIKTFNEWKISRTSSKYLILKMKKQGEIDFVNDANEQVEKWEDFAKVLKPNEACWGLFKFSYMTKDGANRSKLLLVQWIPSDADKRDKMSYAMTTTKVKASLAGIHTTIQACGIADLDFDTVLQRATRFERDEI